MRTSGFPATGSNILFASEARRQLASGAARRAIETCKKGLARYPGTAAGYVVLAAAYRAAGEPDRARLVLQRGYERTRSTQMRLLAAEFDVAQDVAVVGGLAPEDIEQTLSIEVEVDVAIPDPDIAIPDVADPDVAIPDVAVPDVAVVGELASEDVEQMLSIEVEVDVAIPDAAIPDVAIPDVADPDVAVVGELASEDVEQTLSIEVEVDVAIPVAAIPDAAIPDVAIPDAILAEPPRSSGPAPGHRSLAHHIADDVQAFEDAHEAGQRVSAFVPAHAPSESLMLHDDLAAELDSSTVLEQGAAVSEPEEDAFAGDEVITEEHIDRPIAITGWFQRIATASTERDTSPMLALHSGKNVHRLRSANLRLIPGLEFAPLRAEENNRRMAIAPIMEEPLAEWQPRRRDFADVGPPLPDYPASDPTASDDSPVAIGNSHDFHSVLIASTKRIPNPLEASAPPPMSSRESSPAVPPRISSRDSSPAVPPDAEPRTQGARSRDNDILSFTRMSGIASNEGTSEIDDLARRLEGARISPVGEAPGTRHHVFEPSIVSDTLADILVSQGAYGEAIKAFMTLARSRPDRLAHYESRIEEMQQRIREQQGRDE